MTRPTILVSVYLRGGVTADALVTVLYQQGDWAVTPQIKTLADDLDPDGYAVPTLWSRRYTVVHVPSGLYLAQTTNKKRAVAACVKLATLPPIKLAKGAHPDKDDSQRISAAYAAIQPILNGEPQL